MIEMDLPTLQGDEFKRYSRHIIMPEVGMEGQRKLKAGSVLCIGAGGLGSPVAMYLAAAGVGRIGIVAFPNFAHWPNRLSIVRGRMPVTKRLPYQWYDTPNIRVGTFKDFEVLATKNRLAILDAFGLQEGREVRFLPNARAGTAVFKFERG